MQYLDINIKLENIDFGDSFNNHVQRNFRCHNIETLKELCLIPKAKLKSLRGFGLKSIDVIKETLEILGVRLGMPESELNYIELLSKKEMRETQPFNDSMIWEQRRYEIAKGLVCSNCAPKEAILKADELIRLLKGDI